MMLAGLVLTSDEVRPILEGKLHLRAAYVTVRSGEAWVIGSTVTGAKLPDRDRKLLLTRKEIREIDREIEAGRVVLPVRKVSLRGKIRLLLEVKDPVRKRDIRESEKAKEARKEIACLR